MSEPVSSKDPLPTTAAEMSADQMTLPPAAAPGDVTQSQDSGNGAETATVAARVPGYDLVSELGRGGMGVVYKARQRLPNRPVALKMILAGAHAGAEACLRFLAEAEVIAKLRHPNIVQVFEVGQCGGQPFFSLEYCDGGNLGRKLAGAPLPAIEAAELVKTLAGAVHAAHSAGIVHRDLKPANVLLLTDGTPKVSDFGLAKQIAGQGGVELTASGAVMGSPPYMAPEQAGGRTKLIGVHTDVYALGAILYECLTGRPPFRAATVTDTLMQVVNDEPVSPRRLKPNIPRDLEKICLKCLRKEPAGRYASAAALAEDLQRFLAGRPVQARPVGTLARGWRWCRRNPALTLLSLSVLFLLAAMGTGTLMIYFIALLRPARPVSQWETKPSTTGSDPIRPASTPENFQLLAPDTAWTINPPQGKAGFAVFGNANAEPGTVMIILDTSTSMVIDEAGRPTDKFSKALEALKTVLRELPPRTEVGMVRFSGRGGVNDAATELVLVPATHDYRRDRNGLDNLIAKLRKDSANSQVTPLARSIKQVVEGVYFKQAKGFKSVVVLTDGEDTVDGARSFDIVKAAIGTQDISLQIVLFNARREEITAIEQFERISELLTPGKLWRTNDKNTLIAYLQNAMRPQIGVFQKNKNRDALEPALLSKGGRGLSVPLSDDKLENWSPPLEPGQYYVRAFGKGPWPVNLEPGDRLMLELNSKDGAMRLLPYRFTSRIAQVVPTRVVSSDQEPARLHLALPKVDLIDRQGSIDLEMTVMLERAGVHSDVARFDRPKLAWFEVRTVDQKPGAPPLTLAIENLDHYPSSTWRVRVPNWPASAGATKVEQFPAAPQLTAVWLDRLPPPHGFLARDVKQVLAHDVGLHKTVVVDGKVVKIDSVTIEDRTLVVQARHEPGKPVLIQATGLTDRPESELKQEHQFRNDVGQYTARFGPAPTLDDRTAFALTIHSLTQILANGQKLSANLNLRLQAGDPKGFPVRPIELK